MKTIRPPRLTRGDKIRLVSPASRPDRDHIDACAAMLRDWGLQVEIAPHAFDQFGFLAGRDEDRLADLNDAFRDPTVRAIMATKGGKGAYRIADRLDFDAARRDPKLLIGFSEITILHLALYKHAGLAGLHGASWTPAFSQRSTTSLHRALFSSDPVVLNPDPTQPTAALTTTGTAEGILVGGNQNMIGTAAGWTLPDMTGKILLLENSKHGLGSIDRQLTMLRHAGHLDDLAGVVVGQYEDCAPGDPDAPKTPGLHTCLDVLADHVDALGVPVLGGLPIGHGAHPLAVPVGTLATLDADQGRLKVQSAVI